MNWIRRAWRALVRASEPEAPRRVNVSDHPGAMLEAFDAEQDARVDRMLDRLDEHLERSHAEITRRTMLRRAAAVILASGTFAREGMRDVVIPPAVASEPPRWDDRTSNPLADIMEARRKVEAAVGFSPSTVLLGAGHRAYILAHFGLDVAKPETREELGRELGMRVELATPA